MTATVALSASQVASWRVEWGDGQVLPSSESNAPPASASHVYSADGEYLIRFTVMDASGLSVEASVSAGIIFANVNAHPDTSALTVNAGPDQELQLPAQDVTLFGSVSGTSVVGQHDGLYLWTQDSGPASGTFSAPWDRHTSVNLTTAGTYVFRLTCIAYGTSAADTVTVTVLAESAATKYYVDPTYTGGSNDGSAAHPWTTISYTTSAAAAAGAWGTINAALASNHVVVFFSARQAGSDTVESTTNTVNLWRTDTSTHQLIFDGKSKYNTSDTSGSWTDYAGSNRHKLNCASGGGSIGVQSDQTAFPMHYTRIRGFECTGINGRVLIGGSHVTLEHSYIHGINSGTDATVQLQGAINTSNANVEFGRLTDITFRSLTIGDSDSGEYLYLAGSYTTAADFDQAGGTAYMTYGNTHDKILVEYCDISHGAGTGEQFDAIDIKAGLTNVTIRGNTISNLVATTTGISALGVFWPTGQGYAPTVGNYLIENNRFQNGNGAGGIILSKMSGCVIRNNILNAHGSIQTSGNDPGTTAGDSVDYWKSRRVQIYNNVVRTGIVYISYADLVVIKNNIIIESTNPYGLVSIDGSTTNASNVTEGYNATHLGVANVTSLGGSFTVASPYTGLFVDLAGGDFHLGASSVAKDTGTSLATMFAVDFAGATRSGTWDIGAYAA
jgi:hypothetical protein